MDLIARGMAFLGSRASPTDEWSEVYEWLLKDKVYDVPVTPINSVPMYAKRALGIANQTPKKTPTSFL